MSDLHNIFRNSPTPNNLYGNSLGNSHVKYQSISRMAARSEVTRKKQEGEHFIREPITEKLMSDSYAKKIITSTSLTQEINWFYSNYRIEAIINMIVLGIWVLILHHINWIDFQTGIIIGLYFFFYFSVKYHFYRQYILRKWAEISLIASFFSITHILYSNVFQFLSFILFNKRYPSISILPSLQVGLIMLIFLKTASSLTTLPKTPQIILQILQKAPQKVVYMSQQIRAAKSSIILIYVLTLLIEIIAIFFLEGVQLGSINRVINPMVIFSQIMTILFMNLLEYIFITVYAQTISSQLLSSSYSIGSSSINYSEKNTKCIPLILEMLRLQKKQGEDEKKINRVHQKSLHWILSILCWNQHALETRIRSSKFFESYWDIFGAFAEKNIKQIYSKQLLLQHSLENYEKLKNNWKEPHQDLFFGFRLIFAGLKIWKSAINWAENYKCTDLVVKILVEAASAQNWSPVNIEKGLKEVQRKNKEIERCCKNNFMGKILTNKIEFDKQVLCMALKKIGPGMD